MAKSNLELVKKAEQRNLTTNTHQNQSLVVDKVSNMKDTFGKREYKCKCSRITTDYVWESQLPKHEVKCFQCAKSLGFKDLNKKEVPQTASIRTPTKNR